MTSPAHQSRRDVLAGSLALSALAACTPTDPAREPWREWQAEWRRMEAIVRARGWKLTPLAIGDPASSLRIAALEKTVGLPFPAQLREAMLRFSAKVAFGWHVPSHLMPSERESLPTSSALRNIVWDIDHIADVGIPNFFGWKRDIKDRDLSEAPNRPQMWENQFPIADFVNGDMLTIDVSKPDGPQPVRYFSHELEGIHAFAVAPDFYTFVGVLSRLGWAGSEQNSWFPFLVSQDGDRRYLSTATEGAKAWAAWLARDPAKPPSDEPPEAITASTPAERLLLKSAEERSPTGIRAALAAGARADVVRHGDDLLESGKWEWQFATALSHVVAADDLDTAALLLERGASLDTRRLAVNEAVAKGSLETLRWTIARGGRAKGWRHDRYHPIHTLLTRRIEETAERLASERRSWEELRRSLGEKGMPTAGFPEPRQPVPLPPDTILAMLDALLSAGADPNAPWDNGLTMLMWRRELPVIQRLLAAGARIDIRDSSGETAMHWAQTSEKARLLARHGADVNALSTPPSDDEHSVAWTPLHRSLVGIRREDPGLIETLLSLGADPRIRDGKGRPTLAWCYLVGDFERLRALGLDPHERLADGGTLLHAFAQRGSLPRTDQDLAYLDHLLAQGLRINDVDTSGRTMLHVMVGRETATAQDVRRLVERGADTGLRDRTGRRPYDLARASETELRDALK